MNNKYIDLHIHLDGAITVDIAKELAQLQNIKLPSDDDEQLKKLLSVPADCRSLNDFLKCFALPCSLMMSYEGLQRAAYLVCKKMKDIGVVYSEIRFAPQNHTGQGMSQEEAIDAVCQGIKQSGLKANVIACFMRGDDNDEANYETLAIAKKLLVEDGGVVAVDLAGAEALFSTAKYRDIFKKAQEDGVPFTIHAGEADGAESVRLAIEYGAKRIGHGVHAIEDDNVVQLIKDKGIYLDMCPTSERQTRAIEDTDKYPFMNYLNQGIKVTINTDDPAIEGTDIVGEYQYMKERYGLTSQQEMMVINNAIDGAFTSQSVKNQLHHLFELDEKQ